MSTVIFGGSGFIGTHLARSLVARGETVVVADLQPPRLRDTTIDFVACDVRKPIELNVDERVGTVYNLAAVHRTPGHDPHEYYTTNVGGALNVLRWCESIDAKNVTFTSSIAVYGSTEAALSETDEPQPTSDYGRSKFLAEQVHVQWAERDVARRLNIVRPAVIFGAGELGNFSRLARALRARRFVYPGRTDVIKSCGYVGDLVESFSFIDSLTDRGRVELYNFAYPERYTIEDICKAFSRVAGYHLPRSLPAWTIGSAMRVLKTVNPADHGTLSSARVAKLTASTNILPKSLEQLGFTWPTTIESGLTAWRTDPLSDGSFA